MNNNDFYPHAYSIVGKRYYESHLGHHTKRISMIGGLCAKEFIAPFMFEGHCNTKVFEAYIEKVLIPVLNPGQTVVIDNASFHKSKRITQLIENAGCQLIYLAPYSPDLNPIEHYWHKIKTCIRKLMRNIKIEMEEATANVLKNMATC